MSYTWPKSRDICADRYNNALPGAKAYFYKAGTSTPLTVYQDSSLSVAHTHPVLADSEGRWPRIFISYESYRERITTAGGVVLWDDDNIDNPAPVTITSSEDESRLISTGDILFDMIRTIRAGWVPLNGRTIGSALSGASERPNDDTEDLYTLLWDNLPDTICAVTGGRGASAAADFAANKPLALPDARGRGAFGLDSMGASASSRLPSGSFALGVNQRGAVGGSGTKTLSLTEIPSHDHGGSTGSAGAHNHTHDTKSTTFGAGQSGFVSYNYWRDTATGTTSSASDHTHTIAAAGGGQAFALIPPAILGTWFAKL